MLFVCISTYSSQFLHSHLAAVFFPLHPIISHLFISVVVHLEEAFGLSSRTNLVTLVGKITSALIGNVLNSLCKIYYT